MRRKTVFGVFGCIVSVLQLYPGIVKAFLPSLFDLGKGVVVKARFIGLGSTFGESELIDESGFGLAEL